MSSCKLDHSLDDVIKKLEDQRTFLPAELYNGSRRLLMEPDQHTLNELFHILKKYDLASEEVKEERNEHLKQLITA